MEIEPDLRIISFITNLAKEASLLEINTQPKIGNIGPGKAKDKTTYKDFIVSVDAISSEIYNFLKRLAEKFGNYENLNEIEFSKVEIGKFYLDASTAMMECQKGGNTLLGHILLFGPLVAAMYFFIKHRKSDLKELSNLTASILDNTTDLDAIHLYKAIRLANPGGLGSKRYLDVFSDSSFDEIRSKKISLKEIFKIGEKYDFLSYDLANNYPFTYKFSYINLLRFMERYPMDKAILLLLIAILVEIPDTLIIRKHGLEKARYVRTKAKEIFNTSPFSPSFYEKIKKLDEELSNPKCYINPGTSADLTASGILVTLFMKKFSSSFSS